jgi:hypothetical protein
LERSQHVPLRRRRAEQRATHLVEDRLEAAWSRPLKLSNDQRFDQNIGTFIGLYLDPPASAGDVLRQEEPMPSAGTLTPGLPLGPRHLRTMTHDYSRHGTTTLFAALVILKES